ncbi:MAG: hypothetical protein A2V90_09615 [Gammaproteobacteria bacterium RBG_16_57_12]|nr:MAG: hypothetical protein A2V90_09615 [Gammaproteobacteria bacterium RBG_16_57_12]
MPPQAGLFWLLTAMVMVVTPQLFRQPLLITALCLTMLAWRLWCEVKHQPLPGTIVKLILTLVMCAVIYLQYNSFSGLEAGTALLTIMLCVKLLEMCTLRDTLLVIFIGYFLVVAGFLFDQSIFSGAYLLVVVLMLTATLIVLNHPASQASPLDTYYPRLAGNLLLQAIPLMLVLFVLFPRIPGPLWALPAPEGSARTGLSDEMNIGTINDLANSDEVAFRVEFIGEPPAADQLYWRGPVLWHTDGRHWEGLENGEGVMGLPVKPELEPLGQATRYRITLVPHNRLWLFALDLPTTIPGDSVMRFDYQLLAKEKIADHYRYEVVSHTRYRTPAPSPAVRELALDLPDRNPQTRALAQGWRAGGLLPQQIVQQALDLFSQQDFYYTRQPPVLNGPDPIDEFLFRTRKGFCEHYAAGFVTLMRAAGIPARVVTGYQGGELNPLGHYLIVRQSDAHAWAEVWLDGRGWVRVDPTAVIPPQRVVSFSDNQRFRTTLAEPLLRADLGWLARGLHRVRSGWDAVNYQWTQWVLGYDPQKQQQLLQDIGLGNFGWAKVIAVMFTLLMGLLLLVAAYLLLHRPTTSDPVTRAYRRFCRKLASCGVQRHAWEGPADFAVRAGGEFPALQQSIRAIAEQYADLRYGRSATPDDARCFIKAVTAFKIRK